MFPTGKTSPVEYRYDIAWEVRCRKEFLEEMLKKNQQRLYSVFDLAVKLVDEVCFDGHTLSKREGFPEFSSFCARGLAEGHHPGFCFADFIRSAFILARRRYESALVWEGQGENFRKKMTVIMEKVVPPMMEFLRIICREISISNYDRYLYLLRDHAAEYSDKWFDDFLSEEGAKTAQYIIVDCVLMMSAERCTTMFWAECDSLVLDLYFRGLPTEMKHLIIPFMTRGACYDEEGRAWEEMKEVEEKRRGRKRKREEEGGTP